MTPADAPGAWREAARAEQERLRSLTAHVDCGAIGIEVAGEHGFVAFTTRDGRQAIRPLRSPDEIGPLVEALLVTLPAETGASDVAEPPTAPTSSTPVDRAPPQPVPTTARFVLHAEGGGRVSSPGSFASPSIGASAGALVGAWDLSAFGRWDPAYVLGAGAAPQGFAMSRYAVGVTAGRRAALGGTSFLFGLSTGIAVTSESWADPNGQSTGTQPMGSQGTGGPTGNQNNGTAGGGSAAEPLAGVYVGVVFPRRSPLRLRSELSAEAVASRIGRTLSIDPVLPSLPWWSASASVGIEWALP